jgi:hypothetical protein
MHVASVSCRILLAIGAGSTHICIKTHLCFFRGQGFTYRYETKNRSSLILLKIVEIRENRSFFTKFKIWEKK